jgi:hypothetical protein
VIVGIQVAAQADLLQIADASGPLGLLARGFQGRHQHRRQDGNVGDDHQQFYEGEGEAPGRRLLPG